MSFAVFLPLLVSLGVCLLPVWLLGRPDPSRLENEFVAPGYTPPEAIRNSSIAYSLRMVAFWPAFILGAVGNFWVVALGAFSFGLGVYLLYALRQRIFPFLQDALDRDRSITVHAFIARQYGDDARVRLLAAGLTLFALVAAIACEAFALYAVFEVLFDNDTVARALAFTALLLAMLYALPAGHAGVMYCGQLQLGAIFLGLFGAAALLLYQHVSALTPLPTYGIFVIALTAVGCLAMLIYRRSRYIETGSINPNSGAARLLSKFGKILNPVISVFLVLVLVLAGMEFWANGPAAPSNGLALKIPLLGWAALALLPLFYPLANVVHWQRMAAMEKNRAAYQGDTARWLKSLRDIFRVYAAEIVLLWLFAASLGTIAAAALAPAAGTQITSAFIQAAASGDNPVVTAAFSLFLMALAAIALSTMAASFSAGLCTLRYDLLPTSAESSSNKAGRLLFLAALIALIAAAELVPASFTVVKLLALAFALGTPLLSFAPLILGPILTGQSATAGLALLVLAAGAGCAAGGLAGFIITGDEAWLWGAAPVCVVVSFALYAARLSHGSRMR